VVVGGCVDVVVDGDGDMEVDATVKPPD